MEQVKHETRKHALLSASGASRWLNCTPSARLEERFGKDKPSAYAEEGTLAHELSELKLRNHTGEMTDATYKKEVAKIMKNPLFSSDMLEQTDKYTSLVLEFFSATKDAHPDAVLLLEEKFDFSHVVEQGFGTGDACIIADDTLHIIDLKYGKGIEVSAFDNPQLKIYALGALRHYELHYNIDNVRLTIVQPRLDAVSSFEVSVNDLLLWAAKEVKPAAERAYKGEGELCVGSWCKFCKVKAACRKYAEANLELAKHDFKDPELLSDDELLQVFAKQPMLQDWVASVAEHLLSEALRGKKWQGFKLVEGRSQRKWSNETAVVEALLRQGLSADKFTETTTLTVAKMEKAIPKEALKSIQDFILKPPGAPTLVPASDKRPEFNSASEDFK
jgi:hypothetical protein